MSTTSLKSRVYFRTRIFAAVSGVTIVWVSLGMPVLTSLPKEIPLSTSIVSAAVVLFTIIVVAVGSLPGAELKARLVFLRWKNPLPGSRAFDLANLTRDSRIDQRTLKVKLGGRFPRGATEQNATWYRLFQNVQNDPRILEAHFEFLLYRDLTWFSTINTLVAFVSATLNQVSQSTTMTMVSAFVLLSVLFGRAAAERGTRFVNTVLAITASTTAI